MKLAIIGVGNAGSKVVDRMIEFEDQTNRDLFRHALAVNTAATDLRKPEHIPEHNRVLFGETDQRAKGHGVGGDPELGREVAERDLEELRNAIDGVSLGEIDAFLVAAGLGGGTGSGAGPVLIEALQSMYAEPVYALGVLPGENEGGKAAMNAARSLQSFVSASDNFLAFDNDAWRATGQSIEDGYAQTNHELAVRFVTLLAAGEVDESAVAEVAMDSSDVIRTLAAGGVSSIAYSATDVTDSGEGGLLNRMRNGHKGTGVDNAKAIMGLVRRAMGSRQTLPCDVSSAERVLLVVSGPPNRINRKGVEDARKWLERECDVVEVLAGDDPREHSGAVSVAILLSNVTESERIDALQAQGVSAQRAIQEQDAVREQEVEELITDEGGELDPI